MSKKTHARVLLVLGLGLALATAPSPLRGQEVGDEHRIDAVLVSEGPRVDGILDDAVWDAAAVVRDFTQQEPDEGAPASEATEVRVLYDGSSLFIGVRAHDSSPGGPVATEMRRDADRILEEDNFQVILDTFRDSRSAYMFVISPLGAQLDQQVFDEGGRDRRASATAINKNWDGVWEATARRTQDGWVAEMRIPMVNMRFPASEPQAWGINFKRVMPNRNEEVFWAPIPRAFDLTRVSLAGSLEGLHSLDRGLDLRVKPYATGGGHWQNDAGAIDNSGQGDAGLDVKYGITAGLNLDVTVNTDFAQAEVDDEQVNLTRFALFYPEKREFFLENAGQFTVGTTNSTGRIADLFFSRRIGLTSTREEVPILGGARLTGKVGANNIALMDIQTDNLGSIPSENFLVARYARDVGRSQIGGMFVNKQATSGGHFNRTYAADVSLVLTPSLTVDGFLAGTETRGVSDGDVLGGHLRAGWLDRSWRIYAEYTDLGRDFNPEVGFVPRVDMRRSKFHFEGNPRPGKWGIRMMEPMWNVTYVTDQGGRLVSRQFHHMVGTRFENGAYFNVMYNRYFERLDGPYTVVSGIDVPAGKYNFWDLNVSFRSNPSRRLTYNVNVSPQRYWDGDRTDYGAGLGLRVTSQLATSVDFSRRDVRLPAGDFTADIGSLGVDYAFSPTLSLRALSQYNSLTDQISTSARLRYIFRPGSDIYVVYDEVRRDEDLMVSPFVERFRDRQLLIKVTYLLTM